MVDGLDKFNKRFEAIPKNVRDAAVRAIEKSADELVADMRRIAPRDTGTLRDNINWLWGTVKDASQANTMSMGTFKGRRFGTIRASVYAGLLGNNMYDNAWYAHFVEFGTKNMRARPFFFPVYRARRNRVRSRITREINKAIKAS